MCREDCGLENVVGPGTMPQLYRKNKTRMQKNIFGTVIGVVCTKTTWVPGSCVFFFNQQRSKLLSHEWPFKYSPMALLDSLLHTRIFL